MLMGNAKVRFDGRLVLSVITAYYVVTFLNMQIESILRFTH